MLKPLWSLGRTLNRITRTGKRKPAFHERTRKMQFEPLEKRELLSVDLAPDISALAGIPDTHRTAIDYPLTDLPPEGVTRQTEATTIDQGGASSNGMLAGLTLYWDTNGATAGLGGSGTWNATAANWSTSPLGNITTRAWAAGSDAIFTGTAGTVTISGTVSLKFQVKIGRNL